MAPRFLSLRHTAARSRVGSLGTRYASTSHRIGSLGFRAGASVAGASVAAALVPGVFAAGGSERCLVAAVGAPAFTLGAASAVRFAVRFLGGKAAPPIVRERLPRVVR